MPFLAKTRGRLGKVAPDSLTRPPNNHIGTSLAYSVPHALTYMTKFEDMSCSVAYIGRIKQIVQKML